MAADILVGLLIGGLLVAFLNPYRGIYFHIRGLKQQIEFYRDGGSEPGSQYHDPAIREKALDDSYPNRKENT